MITNKSLSIQEQCLFKYVLQKKLVHDIVFAPTISTCLVRRCLPSSRSESHCEESEEFRPLFLFKPDTLRYFGQQGQRGIEVFS